MNSSSTAVTTWSLEQLAPEDLVPPGPEAPRGVRVVRAEVPSPEFSRFLYDAVGGDYQWGDRLPWTYRQWLEFLDRPAMETWVAYEWGTPAGYIELDPQEEGTVEISHFGLLPAFQGRGVGGHLLTWGTARAWDLAERWPERPATRRVWVHTCSRDSPAALGAYQARGFRLFRTEESSEPTVPPSAPWPAG
ncbi:GNAT family N-acetyltransferase [Streptomyces sp. AJS327]|uniref:GNAT family N-acetyltransferase n=1 Tax=Streptomyces sp. AJS327 TaxID=2545265 RepID=UPI0015DF3298|nr:GNAT family N-acetyltransferase [Streptomyces sp. AJS327]MBA0052088.1 GNAT family N-acetyltransferase [Streptomyces sp. AJS327]